MDFYGFYTGKIFDAYEFLGAHPDKDGTTFRTFAPAASRITVIGEFNDWQEWELNKTYDGNFWECYAKGAKPGMMYKYRIYRQDGNCVEHCDPYGFGMELRPNFASIIRDLSHYKFKDSKWMQKRSVCKDKPLNIYELHFGSFKKPSEKADDWYTYVEMIDILIPYLKENDYNYIEIMPLSEHPCDESWGYQNTGFFSPTSRYGTAEELMKFIDACHKNDIGVIMDFVPVHFAVDHYALADYDGTSLYEYPHQDVGVSEWGSCNFMHSRGEVRSFLQSAANYWLSVYHVDGIRMDAISRIIYWQGEPARGVNNNAVDFIREMNRGLKTLHPTAMLSAEDSTSFEGVTKPADQGGLGFDYKWDMGWMNDTLDYFRTAPEYRSRDYHKLTFSMMYYYNDVFLLPLSHDEVVHGKATIAQKMHGEYEEKFPQARAFYMYMYAHPGKKLNFMGNEIGQLREWDEKREQDWDMLEYPLHDSFREYIKALNKIYLKYNALHYDYGPPNFKWEDCNSEERCVYAIRRKSKDGDILAVMNFSDWVQFDYSVTIGEDFSAELLLDSDNQLYSGKTPDGKTKFSLSGGKLVMDIPPYSGRMFLLRHETGSQK